MLSIVVLVSIFIVVSSTSSICGTSYGSIVIVAVVAVVVVIERAEAICIKSVTALIAHYLYQRFAIKLLLRIVSFLRNRKYDNVEANNKKKNFLKIIT